MPEELVDERPTTKLVYCCLDDADQRLSQDELVRRTGLARRAIRTGLQDLIEDDVVIEEPYFGDLREKRYRLRARWRSEGGG
jgi:hypothetical protein